MARPTTSNWLVDPVIPAPPALPRVDLEIPAMADAAATDALHPSGTWRVGTHPLAVDSDSDSERFATSDSEAPTVRPGALHTVTWKRR